jgi:predicted RNA polymerase sigma factor
MTLPDIHRTIDAVWQIESARLIASLTRLVHDVGLAEDLAQGALVAALEQWPQTGIPEKPGAWLMVTAKHHTIDQIRRNVRLERKIEEMGRDLELEQHIDVPEDAYADSDEDMGLVYA